MIMILENKELWVCIREKVFNYRGINDINMRKIGDNERIMFII